MRPVLNPLLHEAAGALRFVGLRNRLRCPRCDAVGTWKPHGMWSDREDVRRVRRWLCKWCGYYVGPEGEQQAYPDPREGVWKLAEDTISRVTPADVVRGALGATWPWRG